MALLFNTWLVNRNRLFYSTVWWNALYLCEACRESDKHKQSSYRLSDRIRHLWLIGLCSVLRPRQHSIGYIGDGDLWLTSLTTAINLCSVIGSVSSSQTLNWEVDGHTTWYTGAFGF